MRKGTPGLLVYSDYMDNFSVIPDETNEPGMGMIIYAEDNSTMLLNNCGAPGSLLMGRDYRNMKPLVKANELSGNRYIHHNNFQLLSHNRIKRSS